ncbi:MAG: hypothetical protein QM605_06055 [Sphingobium sp.]
MPISSDPAARLTARTITSPVRFVRISPRPWIGPSSITISMVWTMYRIAMTSGTGYSATRYLLIESLQAKVKVAPSTSNMPRIG